jgi:hypothetical protein
MRRRTVIWEDFLKLAHPKGIVIYLKKHGDGLICIRGKLLFISLQDQPERQGENHLTGGSPDFHCHFGFSFTWQDFKDELWPCINCRDVLLNKTRV